MTPSLIEVAALQRQLAEALILLERFEFLPCGAMVARRVVDGAWITDDEIAAECNQPKFICPVCTWPQRGHNGPGRYHGNAENTHEQGCSMYAVLHGEEAPRIGRDRVPTTHPLAEVFRVGA